MLGLRQRIGRVDGHRGRPVEQGQPPHRVGAEHVEHGEVPAPILVEVGEIDPHGKQTRMPHHRRRRGPEAHVAATALVEPNPIGRLEIVADVQVGFPIAIEITKLRRQPPFKRRMREGFARRVQKGPLGPRHRHPPGASIIPVKDIGFTEFFDAARGVDLEAVGQVRV